MTTFLSKDVQAGLDAARLAGLKRSSRIRVQVGETRYPVLRLWRDGFSVARDNVPALRGLVDLYVGSVHLYQCLIVASEEEAGEMRYEFKRSTTVSGRAPLDYYRDPKAPVGLLTADPY